MFDSFSRSFGSTVSFLADSDGTNVPEPVVDPFFGAIASYQICGCCGNFHAVTDGTDGGGQGVILNADDRGGFGSNGKPSLGPIDAGAQITRSNTSWATGLGQPAVVTFAFRDSFVTTLPDGTSGHNAFSAAQISATLLALAAWSDVANITFQRVTDGGTEYSEAATILFGNYTSGQSGAAAFAYLPGGMPGATGANAVQGDVWINNSLSYNATPVMQAYGQQVLLHEIGHAIGLSHPAAYNAGSGGTITYGANAIYFEDSRQYTVMSYFSETNTGGNLGGRYSAVPLLDDIAAAQRLYGANTTTRTGDTVYGFNSNAGQPWFNANTSLSALIFAVWDAGGTDTFDFSGYEVAQTIDLRQGAFSSVGGLVGNIAIAIGAVIENVIGGSGADTIRGNSAANVITGNGGNDQVDGGLGSDTVVFAGARASYTVTWNGQVGTITGLGQTVTVSNVEFLQFSDQTIAAAPTGGLLVGGDITNETITGTAFGDTIGGLGGNDTVNGLAGADTLDGGSGDDVLNGGDGDDLMIGGRGDDALNGGAGHDVADYTDAVSSVTVNLATGLASGGAGADTLAGVEEVLGSIHADTITGDGAANILRGGGGIDTLNGGGGADQLFAGAPGEGGGAPDIVKAQGTANNSIANAVSLAGGFDLGTRSDVANSTTIPHATVVATSHGGMEYYAVTVAAGETVVFDIDNASFDSVLRIFNAGNVQVAQNDDNAADGGPATDSGLSHTFATAGTYYIQVSQWQSGSDATLVTAPPPAGGAYTLHVSAPSAPVVALQYLGATLNGEAGADVLNGGVGRDTLNGGADDDLLTGGLENDAIDGGAGTDTAVFSGNRAAYTISASGGVTTVTGPDGTDSLTNVERLEFADGLFDITGAPLNPAINGTSGSDVIVGTANGDTINGLDGDDVITGGGGNDTIDGGAGTDTAVFSGTMAASTVSTVGGVTTVDGPDGVDSLTNVERLRFSNGTLIVGAGGGQYFEGDSGDNGIIGTGFADELFGLGGDDTLVGGGGADLMVGGAGNDRYYVDDAGDVVIEGAGAGVDEIRTTISYTLANGVEVETLMTTNTNGTTAIDLTGNAGNNSITGNAGVNVLIGGYGDDVLTGMGGDDVLDGSGGADVMIGGVGDDLYYVDKATDVIAEFEGNGFDEVRSAFSYTLTNGAAVEVLGTTNAASTTALNLTGNGFNNAITGNAGINSLKGAAGDDVLTGLAGDDRLDGGAGIDTAVFAGTIADYTVSTVGSVTTVTGPDGTDTLTTIERLRFSDGTLIVGAGGGQYFEGDSEGNTIIGTGFADELLGFDGNDILNGIGGADRMIGGMGDDLYYVNDAGDVVTELVGEGTDEVRASISYVLSNGVHVESLATTNAAGVKAINLTGNSLDNTVTGNAGANALNGGSGNDTLYGLGGDDTLIGGSGADLMVGGAGNDRYYVDDAGDVIIEGAGAGVDEIRTTISYTLANGVEVETLMTTNTNGTTAIDLTGNAGNNSITGNAGVNVLIGGYGDDVLTGLDGDDVLDGSGGADVMIGGVGDDLYYVDKATDVIAEFEGNGFDEVRSAFSYTLTNGAAVEVLGTTNAASTTALNLTGNGFNNAITGNAGINSLKGAAGDDVLTGLAGDDRLDGGAGIDTATFSGNRAAYSISTVAGVTTVTGADGSDTLTAIEQLMFSDGLYDINGNPLPPAAPDQEALSKAGAILVSPAEAGIAADGEQGQAASGIGDGARVLPGHGDQFLPMDAGPDLSALPEADAGDDFIVKSHEAGPLVLPPLNDVGTEFAALSLVQEPSINDWMLTVPGETGVINEFDPHAAKFADFLE